jgi:hypothetical protein
VLYVLLASGLILAGVFTRNAVVAQRQEPPRGDRADESEYVTRHIRDLTSEQLTNLVPNGMTPLYHFAGVVNRADLGRGTAVLCTNIDTVASTVIEVQLFNYDATQVDTGSLPVAPLETATFESTTIDFYMADVAMNAGNVDQGYGRILTEHSNVVCTVQVLDADNVPPTWSLDLPVYRQGYGNMLPLVLRNATP